MRKGCLGAGHADPLKNNFNFDILRHVSCPHETSFLGIGIYSPLTINPSDFPPHNLPTLLWT